MCRHTDSLTRQVLSCSSVTGAMLLIFLAGCGTPDAPPVSYPCVHPDLGHTAPNGQPDPCHFEDPDSPAQAVGKFFGTVAAPFCEALYTCCTDQMFLQDFSGGTRDACKSLWTAGGGLGGRGLLTLKASLVNGTTVFDAKALDTCIARLNARIMPPAGAAACVEPAPFVFLNTCMGAAFQGQIEPGDNCAAWPSLPEDLSFLACKDGRCENGKCVPFLKMGEACDKDKSPTSPANTVCNFVQEQWCQGGNGLSGSCGPRLEVGDACDPGNEASYLCKSLDCGQTFKCGPVTPDSTACDVL